MKIFFFVLLIFTSAPIWALESWQGDDYDVESWRCGAPLVEALRRSDPDNLLNDSSSRLKLKESLEKISQSNLRLMRRSLSTLSADEQALVTAIGTKFHAPIVHRTDLATSKFILDNDSGMISATKRRAAARITPNIEEQLFSGKDCIFTSVAPPFGTVSYGPVIFHFKDENRFAWGTMLTGFTWTKEVMNRDITLPATEEMKRRFSRMVFTNNHWDEALALQIIDHVRRGTSIRGKGHPYNKSTILSDLLAQTSNTTFWRKVVTHRLAYLEGHYTDSLKSRDYLFVQFRTTDQATVLTWGLPASWFIGNPHSFIQYFNRAL